MHTPSTISSHKTMVKDMNALVNLIKNKKVIFFVGAGISTSAGIPDFRSPETGLYHNLQKLNLPYAEAVFDISYFKGNPKPFYILANELYPGKFLPTKFHFLMRLFQEKGMLKRVYTQNIDTLERIVGVNGDYIVEVHGSFGENHCVHCGTEYSFERFENAIFKDEIPKCDKCQGFIKPDIVFFGEGLPERFFDLWKLDNDDLDSQEPGDYVIITAGSSLTVYPFASLPSEVHTKYVRVLVNKELVGDFIKGRNNDLIFLESTDEFAEQLVKELGWGDEFERLIKAKEKELRKKDIKKETVTEKINEITKTFKKELEEEARKNDELSDDITKNFQTLGLKEKEEMMIKGKEDW